MFPQNEKRNEGTFACSPRTKTGTRHIRQNRPFTKPPFCLPRENPRVRKIRVRNSGAEMAAPILWTPGKTAFFLQENLHVHQIPRFRGGGNFGFWGGGEVPILFLWARGFF